MAKELPYFKFEPSLWDSGKIQMCSYETQGLFINICALYWTRLGDLPEKLVFHKLCKGNANALQELFEEEVLHIENGKISIKFLDEQIEEFTTISKERSLSAQKRWSKKDEKPTDTEKKTSLIETESNYDAKAMQMHSKSNAIREDKIRGDKSREEDIREKPIQFDSAENKFSSTPKEKKTIEERKIEFTEKLSVFVGQYEKDVLNNFYSYWTEKNENGKKMRFEGEKYFDVSRRLSTWSKNEKKFKNGKTGITASQSRQQRIDELSQLEYLANTIISNGG